MNAKDIKQNELYVLNTDHYQGHGYTKGQPVRVTQKNGSYANINDEEGGSTTLSIPITQLLPLVRTVDKLEEQAKEYDAKAAEVRQKIAWMKVNKVEVFDAEEFRVWQVLETLENKKATKLQKAKIIADLVKGKK